MSTHETFDWIERERTAKRFHASSAGDTTQLWIDGLDVVHSNLSRIYGRELAEIQRYTAGLISASVNSMRCTHTLAMTGYFMQAMNLSRMLAETSTAYWYLKFFPDEYDRFDSPKEPKLNEMLQKLECSSDEPSHILEFIVAIREFIKTHQLHKYSHVSYLTVPATIESSIRGVTSMTFGPRSNAELCHGVFADTLALVFRIVMCTFDIVNSVGLRPTDDASAYVHRLSSHFAVMSEGGGESGGIVS